MTNKTESWVLTLCRNKHYLVTTEPMCNTLL